MAATASAAAGGHVLSNATSLKAKVDRGTDCSGTMAGEWTAGWPADYDGQPQPGPNGPPKVGMEVRATTTSWGTPHAQYVVDYESALAVHSDLQACLGNGTCSENQFGTARRLNSSAPGCTFIQWPATLGGPTNIGWCKAPYCALPPPPPPPPPPPKVPWPATYNLSRSTMVFPDGTSASLSSTSFLL